MNRLTWSGVMVVAAAMALPAKGELVRQMVDYKDGDTQLAGYLVYQKDGPAKRPGVLVVHEWVGLNDYAKRRADMLAELGYVAFALDMYGKGVLAKDRTEAAELASRFKGKPIIRTRSAAGLDVLRRQPNVDPDRVAAIGYCFGGTTVLELAYSGAPLAGVVSFHGGLVAPKTDDYSRIQAKLLAYHGADDPFVPPAEVETWAKAVKEANTDWQLVAFGNTVHSFTNPGSGSDNSTGVAYNKASDHRSWDGMKIFFDEIFSEK